MQGPNDCIFWWFHLYSCWLSTNEGTIWAFIGPVIAIICVCTHNTIAIPILLRRDNIYAFCLDKLGHPVLGHLGDIENKMQKRSRVQDQQIQCSNVSTSEWIIGNFSIQECSLI